MDELREQLAALEHARWSSWMEWMFSQGTLNADGSWTMSALYYANLQRQVNTPYAFLSDLEKDSDRSEADKTLAIINAAEKL